ncbi:hypothetical protein BG006_002094 [Podila minutissima]|uniref:UBX domain-containing protein 2 n=1 Tax=Podila minutissima TaxID=64525 RepID=A0A9P5SBT6_9FUNG|nr:hypothetical protein BG006_002094 [Podila minutissima]
MESPEPQSPWYDGSVAEAVQTANANGSILLVCVVQDNAPESESGRFEARFRKTDVLTTLTEENLISLKLVKDSPDGMMFGQIFPIMAVPALYLIRNGLLTDFMNNSVDEDQMLERIQKAINGHSQIPPPPTISSPAPPAATPQSSASTPASEATSSSPASPVVPPPVDTHVVEPVSPASPSSSMSATPSTPSSSSAPKIDTPEELKELMKQRKLWREKEEKEAAKQRELDRRSSSKVLTNAQRELAEKQNKKLKDQIEKDKREEAEYKKRVKQALEEDKARRRAEREKAQATLAAQSSSNLSGPRDQEAPEVLLPHEVRAQNAGLREARNDAAPALACESSRLNIRLFDGSSIRNTFKATDTLEQVRRWINENQEGDENAYNIVQLIPARTFTDETKMLRDLELCPSATLVLKQITSASSAYSGSGGGAVPTLMGYGWSAVSLAGKLASSAYSTVSYYNPLSGGQSSSRSSSSGSGSGSGNGGRDGREDAANSTSLE